MQPKIKTSPANTEHPIAIDIVNSLMFGSPSFAASGECALQKNRVEKSQLTALRLRLVKFYPKLGENVALAPAFEKDDGVTQYAAMCFYFGFGLIIHSNYNGLKERHDTAPKKTTVDDLKGLIQQLKEDPIGKVLLGAVMDRSGKVIDILSIFEFGGEK